MSVRLRYRHKKITTIFSVHVPSKECVTLNISFLKRNMIIILFLHWKSLTVRSKFHALNLNYDIRIKLIILTCERVDFNFAQLYR